MNDDNRQALLRYRLQQAGEALREAQVLHREGLRRGALARGYYGMFYAVQALIVHNQATISKHTGAISFFDKEFVRTGIFDKELSKWLHQMFDLRQAADYGDMFEPTSDQCDEALAHADEFVTRVKDALASTVPPPAAPPRLQRPNPVPLHGP